MKRYLLTLGILFACVLLASCKTSDIGTGFNQAITDWAPEHGNRSGGQPSQIVTFDDPAFSSELGFDVVSYPDDANLKPVKFFAIDKWFGQIEYDTPQGSVYVVRVARENSDDLTETYKEVHDASETIKKIDGIDVTVQTADAGCTMVTWQRDSFQFLMHCNQIFPAITDAEIEQMVEGLEAENVQAGASGN